MSSSSSDRRSSIAPWLRSIYLVNGIKLQGQVESFDQYVVLLKNTVTQMVYKHAISTVVPARPVVIQQEEGSN